MAKSFRPREYDRFERNRKVQRKVNVRAICGSEDFSNGSRRQQQSFRPAGLRELMTSEQY